MIKRKRPDKQIGDKQQELQILENSYQICKKVITLKQKQEAQQIQENLQDQLKDGLKKHEINSISHLEQEIEYLKEDIEKLQKRNKSFAQEEQKLNELLELTQIAKKLNLLQNQQSSSIENQQDEQMSEQQLNQQNQDKQQEKQIQQQLTQAQATEEQLSSLQIQEEAKYSQNEQVEELKFEGNINLTSLSVQDENQQEKANFQNMALDTETMPNCVEKHFKQLLVWIGKLLYPDLRLNNNINIQDPICKEQILNKFKELKKSLKIEEINSQKIRSYLKEARIQFEGQEFQSSKKQLLEIYKEIILVDICTLKSLIYEVNKAALQIKDKHIILFIGGSGAGKSTTIHYLSGSEMDYVQAGSFKKHIGPIRINNQQLIKIKTSPFTQSETKYITPVTVEFCKVRGSKKKRGFIILCDSPGFNDNRGFAQDIANGIGVIKAIQGCKSVIPVILNSLKSQGGRGEGLQDLANTYIQMCTNFDEVLSTTQFLFTNYEMNQRDDILPTLTDLSQRTKETDEAFMKFFDKMLEKVEEEQIFVDPINDKEPGKLLDKLAQVTPVFNPSGNFCPFISDKARNALLQQAHLHQKCIYAAVKNQNYEIIQYKLEQIIFVIDLVKQKFLENIFNEIIQYLKNYINDISIKSKDQFNRCLKIENNIEAEDILKYHQSIQISIQYQQLRTQYLNNEGLSEAELQENLKIQVNNLLEISKKKEINHFYQEKILQKILLISKENDFQQFKNEYEQAKQNLQTRINALRDDFQIKIQDLKFQESQQILISMNQAKEQLKNHLNISTINEDLTQMENYLIGFLKQQICLCQNSFKSPIISNQEIETFQSAINILLLAQGNQDYSFKNLIDINIIQEIYNEFEQELINLFDNKIKEIKDLFKKDKNDALDQIGSKLVELRLIQNIQQIQKLTSNKYYNILSEIQNYIQQLQKDIVLKINQLDGQNSAQIYKEINGCLVGLKKSKWIKQFDREQFYDDIVNQAEDLILNYTKDLFNNLQTTEFSLEYPENLNQAQQLLQKINQTSPLEQNINDIKLIISDANRKFKSQIDEVLIRISKIIEEKDFKIIQRKIQSNIYTYLSNCCNIQQYKDQADTLIRRFNKFIHQHLEYLDNKFRDEYKSIIYISESESPSQNLQGGLKKKFSSLILFTKFYSEFKFPNENYLNEDQYQGDRILQNLNIFNQDLQEIQQNLILYQKTSNYKQYYICLKVVQYLSQQLDQFIIDQNKQFIAVYQSTKSFQYQNDENLNIIIGLIEQYNFYQVSEKMKQLEEQSADPHCQAQFQKLKDYLINFIDNLAIQTRSISNSISMRQNFTIENIQILVQKMEQLKNASKFLQSFIPNLEIKTEFEFNKQNIQTTFLKFLNKIKGMIKQINFFDAENEIEKLSAIQKSLQQYCDKELIEAFNKLDEDRLQELNKKFIQYQTLEIFNYNIHPPKDIINKLIAAQEINQEYSQKIIEIQEIIINKLRLKLEELSKIDSKQNKARYIQRIKNIFPYLSEFLQSEFNQIINDFETIVQQQEEDKDQELQIAIDKDDFCQLHELYKDYQKDNRNNSKQINQIKTSLIIKSNSISRDVSSILQNNYYDEILQKVQILHNYNQLFGQDFIEIAQNYQESLINIQKKFQKDINQFKSLFVINQQSKQSEAILREQLNDSFDSQKSYFYTQNKQDFQNNQEDYQFIQLIAVFLKFEQGSLIQLGNSLQIVKKIQKTQEIKFISKSELIQEILPSFKQVLQENKSFIEKRFNEENQKFDQCITQQNSNSLIYILQNMKRWDTLIYQLEIKDDIKELQFFKEIIKSYKNISEYHQMLTRLSDKLQEIKQSILNEKILNDQTQNSKLEREQFYNQLKEKFTFIQVFKQLQDHQISEAEKIGQICQESFYNKLQQLINNTRNILGNQRLNINDYQQLNANITQLNTISDILSQYFDKIQGEIDEINTQILSNIKEEISNINESDDYQKISKVLIEIKDISRNLPYLSELINQELDKALKKIKEKHKSNGISKIGICLNQNEIGKQIIQEHKMFAGYQRYIYNQRIQTYTLETVLDKMEGTTIDKRYLYDKYHEFQKHYEELINNNLNQNMDFRNFFSNYKNFLQTNFKKGGFSISRFVKNVLNTFSPNSNDQQEITEFSLKIGDRNKSYIIQLISYLFAYYTLKNSSHYFDAQGENDQNLYLFKPHPAQILSIFRLLGLGTFKEQIVNHLIEIKTGEGKSITLAISASVLAILGCQVYVACYSQYLSDRDFKQFLEFFSDLQISDQIQYGTFNQLAENIINENGEIRDLVAKIVTNQKQEKNLKETTKINTQKILLIDEVDIFFSKELFGNTYTAQSNISDPTITELLDFIWEKREQNLSYHQLIQSEQYIQCIKNQKFQGYEFLIEASFKDMINDLRNFKSHDYVIQDNKIGYKEQDNIIFNQVYGYQTLFAYYQEIENGNIQKDGNFKKFQCIGINCGIFSYAEILLEFQLILGVTGTLNTLSQKEQDIIQKYYNINFYTYSPSVYGDNRLLTMDQREDIKIVSKEDYFTFIEDEIAKKLYTRYEEVQRAVLVFFENKKLLKQFFEESQVKQKYDKIQQLYEGVSDIEKQNKINHASSQGYITLLTKEYGRGTDFISRDEMVNTNGGVHVIQTFLSEEQSEETQIKGRTARQGQNGSYSMILLEDNLEKFDIDLQILKNDPSHKYDYLEIKRDEFFLKQFLNNVDFVKQAKVEHIQAKMFIYNILIQNQSFIKDYLKLKNVGKPVLAQKIKTLILLDATGSMSSLLQKTKNTINNMFYRANDILKVAAIPEGCYYIQIAVFRNYNSHDLILQYSPWEFKSENLYNFLKTIQVDGGQGNEAIEIGLYHANEENIKDELSQVILIGDAPPNTKREVTDKRKGSGYDWSQTKFVKETYFEDELNILQNNNIPVHSFYVHNRAQVQFQEISKKTKGNCQFLDINSQAGADILTDLITKEVLRKVGELQGKGEDCVQLYEKKYGKSYIAV